MIVLVDMDEVLADFEKGLVSIWNDKYPEAPLFPEGTRKQFYIGSGTSNDRAAKVNQIIHTKGFFEELEPIIGAKEAIAEIIDLGHSIFILTSAGISYPNAASEKYRWVERHFGRYMLERLVITPAKPLVKGDILIDDRPDIQASDWAEWEHVLYDKSYNRQDKDKRRLTWNNWKEVLSELL